jgi:putative restriction endonuclease
MTDYALTRDIHIGETFTQSEVEDVFGTDFGYQFRGITYRHPDEGKYIILLSNEGEIYNDNIGSGPEFIYEGEGIPEKGDQTETAANKALIDAVFDPIPIYLFTSVEGDDEYEYRGLVDVEDHRYVDDGKRMVYRFNMRRLGIESWEEYTETEQTVEPDENHEPTIEEVPSYTETQTRVRSAAFSRRVKEIYDYICAVCGAQRFSPDGTPEVEAAHIYPKSDNGNDVVQNGIALCRFHHWAFDCGWFSISDDREVIIREDEEIPEGVKSINGRSIQLPEKDNQKPHPAFLSEHRRLHDFD